MKNWMGHLKHKKEAGKKKVVRCLLFRLKYCVRKRRWN